MLRVKALGQQDKVLTLRDILRWHKELNHMQRVIIPMP
jgi:hypothetical protein